ncbi:MAG: T9SS type A sorting domain-containing protein [Bacteroidota bacterium]
MNKATFLVFIVAMISPQLSAQVTFFWKDSFEGSSPEIGGGVRAAVNHSNTSQGSDPAVCGSSDYFFRTDCNTNSSNGLNCTGVSEQFTGLDGTFMWRGEDLDGCIADADSIDFTGINISGRSNLVFSGLFACDGAANEWEGPSAADGHPDFLEVKYRIDGGTYQRGIIFRSDGSDDAVSGDERGLFRVDTDDDGLGESGPAMGETFQAYSFSLVGTGSTLDIRFIAFVNGGGEEFAIDNFQVGENTPALPVDLASFAGKLEGGGATLVWETLSEKDNYGFVIERNINLEEWVEIGFVPGNLSTTVNHQYTFRDEALTPGQYYYRLKQIDLDGAYQYSSIVALETRGLDQVPFIFPNPPKDDLLNFRYLSSKDATSVSFLFYSTNGQLLSEEITRLDKGINQIKINVPKHSTPLLFLKVTLDQEVYTYRIIN